ncbi:sulfatase-like hydrolase/transferase [Propionibacteriaceae bacterium Y2011]|uniref:sulfatase-like hydrolase/transferase n=1 Tax=Microlunatus sp. Y2014 TaxID=3418488 RepID=UPI003B4B7F03
MTDQPNILVIMSDQHHAEVMGCAGDPVVETPGLDRLAARGARLSNLYCQAPLCAPSRASFLTGMMPSDNGVVSNNQLFDLTHPTFAHSAGAAGYRPELIGKMHVLGIDQLFGFTARQIGDHGPNFPGLGNRKPRSGGGAAPVQRGQLHGAAGPSLDSLSKSGIGHHAYYTRDALVAEATESAIRQHDIERRSGGDPHPFFLTMGFLLPHQPYVATREDYEKYEGRVGLPRRPWPDAPSDDHAFLRWWRDATGLDRIHGGVPEEVILRARTAYWGMVDRMDQLITRVLDTLDELGLTENTLIIYTSDHGDHVGEHGLWWKQTLLEPSVKVPGIISWPGVVPEQVTSDRVCGLVDVTETIVAAAGGPALPRSVGRDLVPMLRGEDPDFADLTLSEHCADVNQGAGLGPAKVDRPYYQRMVRQGRWKYVDHADLPAQLFDVVADPDETTDVSADPANSAVVAELAAIARDGWDPELVRAETQTDIAETALFADWAVETGYVDQHRWQMKAAYNTLEGTPYDFVLDD